MLFGDLLVSSSRPPGIEISLPAIGTIAAAADSRREYHPVGLRQKVCVISDRLMIAWAGTQFVAQSVIKGLRERFISAPVTWTSLDEFFREYGVYELKDVQFIGLYRDNGSVTSFGIHTHNFSDPVLGQCHVGGSGAGKLLAAMDSPSAQRHIEGAVRDVDTAVTSALTFATEFLVEELLAGLQETHFGGGFEIGALTQNGAEKVGDVLNLFWTYDSTQGKNPLLMPVMIKWDYIGEDLIVQRLRQERNGQGVYELPEHVISVITAPDREPGSRRPIPPDLNCRYLCNCYFSFVDHDTVRRTSSVYHAAGKSGPVRFEDSGGELHLTFDLRHFEREWEFVRNALG